MPELCLRYIHSRRITLTTFQRKAQTQPPTTRKQEVQTPTFGELPEISTAIMQWPSLTLGEPTSSSWCLSCQINMSGTSNVQGTLSHLHNSHLWEQKYGTPRITTGSAFLYARCNIFIQLQLYFDSDVLLASYVSHNALLYSKSDSTLKSKIFYKSIPKKERTGQQQV